MSVCAWLRETQGGTGSLGCVVTPATFFSLRMRRGFRDEHLFVEEVRACDTAPWIYCSETTSLSWVCESVHERGLKVGQAVVPERHDHEEELMDVLVEQVLGRQEVLGPLLGEK